MPDSWRRTRLGEVAEVIMGQSPPGCSYNLEGRGLPFIQGSAEFGDVYPSPVKWCDSPRKVAEAGDLLVSVRAPVGATNRARERVAVGRGLAILRGGPCVSTDYLWLLIRHSAIALKARSSAGMFESITGEGLRGLSVTVPGVAEQRRIVDLLNAVNALAKRAAGAVGSARAVLVAILRSGLRENAGNLQPIDRLCSTIIGGVWGKPPGCSDRDVLALGPRVFATGTPGFSTVGSPVRSVTERQYWSRRVWRNDIILERSGGSPDQPVGRVVIADREHEPCIPTDFMRLLRPDPARVESRYLFWRLWLDHLDGRTVGFSRRTTGISNLSVPEYLARSIKVPPPATQQQLIAAADAAADIVACAQHYEERINELGSVLLADLLSGRQAIPASYDRLFEVAP